MPDNGPFSINALSERLGYDRRTLKRWLHDVLPAGLDGGNPTYLLEHVEAAISRALQKTKRSSLARERLINLQADKLAHQMAVLRGEYVAVVDVEKDTAAMITEAKRVLQDGPRQLAPQVVGVSIPEAETLMAEWVHDALTRLHRDPLGNGNVGTSEAPPRFTVKEHNG